MKRWAVTTRAALDLLFPARCVVCGDDLFSGTERLLCPACFGEIHFLRSPLCSRCGCEHMATGDDDHWCEACIRHPPPFLHATSLVRYAAPISQLLHRLKYSADTTVIPAISEIVGEYGPQSLLNDCDLVLPVPLFKRRLQRRGLNQSLILARLFFPELGSQIHADILLRKRDTPAQTALTGEARRKNLAGAFTVYLPEKVFKKKVCLVDDVYTTGTTVTHCCRTLLAAGAASVSVVTLARVVGR